MENQAANWSVDVPRIETPTLLMFADADSVDPAHIVEFYKLLGGGQRDAGLDGSLRSGNRLVIIPGTTHYDLIASLHVAGFASDFLEG
ncbi:MAG: hypothetical protein WKF81_07910 [Thermomicrobiales bacterium]